MKRRCRWLICAVLSVSFAALAEPGKPNVVIFVADDLGYADVSFKGSEIETPSIDSLARDGMVLNRFYTAPICSPTRAALMTGRDPMRLGMAYSVLLPWDNGGLHPQEKLMSESFQEAGYQTAIVGKWHLGHAQEQFTPLARGFDEFYGHLHTNVGYYPPFAMVGGRDFQHNGKTITDEGYESFLLADHASSWIRERDAGKPFFLYVPFIAPHEPLEAPTDLVEKYADLADRREPPRSPSGGADIMTRLASLSSRRPLYAAVVDAMDQAMGRVLTTLEQEGLDDNTIVLFFSDNGASRISGRVGGDNAPLRGGKAETYEGGIRTISMIRWPQKIAAGSSSDVMFTVMDLFPTLAAATGIEMGTEFELDGKNLLPALTEGVDIKREDTVFFGSEIPNYGDFNFTAISGDWKLVQWIEQEPTSTTVRHELFNLKNDLSEYHNLAEKYPDKVQAMARDILQWRARHPINGTRTKLSPPPGWRAPLDWASYPIKSELLQAEPTSSIAPSKVSEQILDRRLKQRGRIIYNCDPNPFLGRLCTNQLLDE